MENKQQSPDPAVRRPRLSLVAPCYNEEAVLPELYARCTRVLQTTTAGDYELILVNDGSSDATWPMIVELTQTDPRVIGVDLSRNFGHQRALTAGLSIARGEAVFVIDADLQDPPELLEEMLRLLDAGADVVYGQRLSREAESRFKRWSAAVFYRVLGRLTDIHIPPDTGDFRLMRRPVVEALTLTAIIGSIQLIAVGIMGEYLGRIYLEVKNRPNFIIRESATGSATTSR